LDHIAKINGGNPVSPLVFEEITETVKNRKVEKK
jgi:hypothetical protein